MTKYYYFEETKINNLDLPPSWRKEAVLDELESFLQENWNLRPAYYFDGKTERKQQFISFLNHKAIRTNHYVGTIMFNGEKVNIFPKMFCSNRGKNDLDPKHLMKNLARWLDYCTRSQYPYIHITPNYDEEEFFKDLFITLYIGNVRDILERGHYHQYVEETNDLVYLKGKFDGCDYILNKIPTGQADHFRCTYSKFDYDNKLNRIIKHTCRLLYPISTTNNQRSINYILTRLNEVSDEKCTPGDCDRIRISNIHDRKMLERYKSIISMSKMFLLNETPGVEFEYNKAFCFLFPTDFLFESFIGGFIEEVVKDYNGKTSLQKSDKYLIDRFEYNSTKYDKKAFNMKPDILVEVHNKKYILDTKYKAVSRFENYFANLERLNINEFDQSDLYQICEYARKWGVNDVFLLYPMYRGEQKEENYPKGISNGFSGNINIRFIRLPYIFEDDEEETRRVLKNTIEDILELEPQDQDLE